MSSLVVFSLLCLPAAEPRDLPLVEPQLLFTATAEDPNTTLSDPVVFDGVLYFAGGNRVYAVNAAVGSELWAVDLPRGPGQVSRPTATSDRVFVVSAGGLVSLDRRSGQQVSFSTAGRGWGECPPVVVGEQVIVAGNDGLITAHDVTTGSTVWTGEVLSDRTTGPGKFADYRLSGGNDVRCRGAVGDGQLYVVSLFDQCRVVAFHTQRQVDETSDDTPESRRAWSYETGGYAGVAAVLSDDAVYVTSQGRHVACLDRETGEERWRVTIDTWNVSRPALFDGKLYVPFAGGPIAVLDAATGQRLADFSPPQSDGLIYTTPLVTEAAVYFPLSRAGQFVALDRRTGQVLWRVGDGLAMEFFSDPATDGETLFVTRRTSDDSGRFAVHAFGTIE